MATSMQPTFLFPNDCFNPKQPDAAYGDRYLAFKQAGFKTALIEIESLEETKVYPALSAEDVVVYLGWMLSATDYQFLTRIIEKTGAACFTSSTEYLATHYLPNWYPLISDLTPETKIFNTTDNLELQLQQLNWSQYFIKDYVKSLKTSVGAIIDRPTQINEVLTEMKKYRGVIEGGVCVRRVEDFITETEERYFVINGQIFASEGDYAHSIQGVQSPFGTLARSAVTLRDRNIPDIVKDCASRIQSNFFSIDVIKRKDGVLRIVEVGDGQVSDLVGWSIERFIQIWQNR